MPTTPTIQLRFALGEFHARAFTVDGVRKIRAAGFRSDGGAGKQFYTPSYTVAARLRDYADDLAKKEIDRKILRISPWPGPLLHPAHQTPRPWQPEAVMFALSRNRAYLGLDPGLGKTPIAVMVTNSLVFDSLVRYLQNSPKTPLFLYVCPPFLAETVREEFEAWKTWDGPIAILNLGEALAPATRKPRVLIIPDSIINRPFDEEEIRYWIDEANGYGDEITLFVDEAHRFKNPEAVRTRAILGWHNLKRPQLGIADRVDRAYYLSGTPIPNRPIELHPILSHAAPETIDFASRYDFGMKYCEGFDTGFGFDFNGGGKKEVKALAEKIKPKFMLRMRKALLDLPPKLEEMIVIGDEMSPTVTKLDASLIRLYGGTDLKRDEIAARVLDDPQNELHTATYRRMLGVEKVPHVVDIAKATLDETNTSLVIFALHTEVIEKLLNALKNYASYSITGKTPMGERHAMVKDFQANKKRRLFIGNIHAMGVGFTLTKATEALFAEYAWSPGVNGQALDRLHRIGQTSTVYGRYVAFKNSLDRAVLETNLRKINATDEM